MLVLSAEVQSRPRSSRGHHRRQEGVVRGVASDGAHGRGVDTLRAHAEAALASHLNHHNVAVYKTGIKLTN